MKEFYDPKRGDLILNPFDARSARWDLFAEIEQPYDVEQLARSLIPDGAGNPSDREWRQYARTFFTAVTRQLHALNDPSMTAVVELYRLIASAPGDELRALLQGTPAAPFLEESNARMFGSIRSVTSTAVASFEYLGAGTGSKFSTRQWARQNRRRGGQKGSVLFMPYTANQIAALRGIISTWMRLAIFETMDGGEGDARVWFIVDELDALGPIDGLKDALARLRKFGGRCEIGRAHV